MTRTRLEEDYLETKQKKKKQDNRGSALMSQAIHQTAPENESLQMRDCVEPAKGGGGRELV